MNQLIELLCWLENRLSAMSAKCAVCRKKLENPDPMPEQYEVCGYRCGLLKQDSPAMLKKQAD